VQPVCFLGRSAMLEWYEADAAQEAHRRAFILVPAVNEETGGNRFHVRYDGTGVSGNPSLAAKAVDGFPKSRCLRCPSREKRGVEGYFESSSFGRRGARTLARGQRLP